MIVATTLSAMVILVRATLFVTSTSRHCRVPRNPGGNLLGVVLLLGTVWLATHAAVLIFAPKSDGPREASGAEKIVLDRPPHNKWRMRTGWSNCGVFGVSGAAAAGTREREQQGVRTFRTRTD